MPSFLFACSSQIFFLEERKKISRIQKKGKASQMKLQNKELYGRYSLSEGKSNAQP